LPTLSLLGSHGETPKRYGAVTVRADDTLWTLAAAHAKPGENMQEAVDEIATINHLKGAVIMPGNRLRIPY
jgi:predicted Zn-dependent protease